MMFHPNCKTFIELYTSEYSSKSDASILSIENEFACVVTCLIFSLVLWKLQKFCRESDKLNVWNDLTSPENWSTITVSEFRYIW